MAHIPASQRPRVKYVEETLLDQYAAAVEDRIKGLENAIQVIQTFSDRTYNMLDTLTHAVDEHTSRLEFLGGKATRAEVRINEVADAVADTLDVLVEHKHTTCGIVVDAKTVTVEHIKASL